MSSTQNEVSEKCKTVSRPSHGCSYVTWGRRARASIADAERAVESITTLEQPGSSKIVAVVGGVVTVPKNGLVPDANLNVCVVRVPVAIWNVPWPPPNSGQLVRSTGPTAWKLMTILVGSMLAPVRSV